MNVLIPFISSIIILFCGPLLVSRTGDAGWTEYQVKEPNFRVIGSHKGCEFIMTAGRWTWRSLAAQKCVTTYLPNELAPKMDGAKPWVLYLMGVGKIKPTLCRRAWRYWLEGQDVSLAESTFSADLGGSSNDLGEKPKHRSGERFHRKGNPLWVSRT